MTLHSYISKNDHWVERMDLNEVFGRSDSAEDLAGALYLLSRAYSEIYCSTFPITSEREDVSQWLVRLSHGEKSPSIQFISLYGKNLADPERAEIGGMICSEYFKGTKTGIICYVTREKSFRVDLKAKNMCDHHEKLLRNACRKIDRAELEAVFWEANDYRTLLRDAITSSELIHPKTKGYYIETINKALLSGEAIEPSFANGMIQYYAQMHGHEYWEAVDCMDPQKRVEHIEKHYGARQVGISYAQPPLSSYATQEQRTAMTSGNMLLYVYNAKAYDNFTLKTLRAYLEFFTTVFSGARSARALGVPAVTSMMDQMDLIEGENLSIWSDRQSPEDISKIRALLKAEITPFASKASSTRLAETL